MKEIIFHYGIFINVLAFLLFAIDKRKARKRKWRIAERVLLGVAILGGSIGTWVGMQVFHHKTLHRKFTWGIPAILVVQVLLLLFVYWI